MVSFLKCPTCGLTNVGTANFCVHCNTPLAQLTQAAELAIAIQAVEKSSSQRDLLVGEGTGSKKIIREILDREFVRAGKKPGESTTAPVMPELKPDYHPLAEKALEKIRRAGAFEALSPQPQTPPEVPILSSRVGTASPIVTPTVTRRSGQSARKSKEIDHIEIDLSQGRLPFDAEDRQSDVDGLLPQGLIAAPLPGPFTSWLH